MFKSVLLMELVLKGTAGALLLLFPVTTARLFGLPHGDVGMWPRLLGAMLLGIAATVWLENDVPDARGIGFGGLIILNVIGTVALIGVAITQEIETTRGKLAIWLVIVALFSLTLFEIAQL